MLAVGAVLFVGATFASAYPRLWIFNNYPMRDPDVWPSVSNMIERAVAAGYNGVLLAGVEDALNGWSKVSLANHEKLRDLCAARKIEVIPSAWGLGYGGSYCYLNPEAIEATEMKGLVYESDGKNLCFSPQPVPEEDFKASDFGARIVNAKLKPFHHYRISFKLKTENLLPDIYYKFRVSCRYVVTGEHQLYDPPTKPTQDWTDVVFTFDTYESGEISFSAGRGARNMTGSFKVKDVRISEWGPCGMFSSDGMEPVVRDAETGVVYEPGRDYTPFPRMKRFREFPDSKWTTAAIPAGSRIAKGAKLLVDCWIPAVEGQRQYSGCPSFEETYRYNEESARKIEAFFHPKTWLLSVDEWRVANRCKRCQSRNVSPAVLMAENVKRLHGIIRKVNPKAEIAAWADMFAPTDNAHDHYYCVKGDITGSWNLVPKDILMVVWENGHGPIALKHFADNGFRTLAGAYYDHNDLDNDRRWLEACNATPRCQGMMYTTWQRKYGLLEDFADMVRKGSNPR